MIHVRLAKTVKTETGFSSSLAARLKLAARQTLRAVGANPQADLTLVITDEAQVHRLNRQFRGVDAPTDVLAFPSGEIDPDSQRPYLGDIIISYSQATAQAHRGGHSLDEELQLLVVHGVLHLLGYDHTEEGDKAVMWALQGKILADLGLTIRI